MLNLFVLLVFLKKDTAGFGARQTFCAQMDTGPLQTIPYYPIP